jgi:hypothetical protein
MILYIKLRSGKLTGTYIGHVYEDVLQREQYICNETF